MKKERIKAKVADLIMNEGQLGWLPTNPRQWTREDVEKTKASLGNDPDFTEERPVLVVECDGKLLVFAGNLRTTAARALKWEYISAVLYTPENDEDKDTIKRRSILDNGAFGSWDYDMLANEWDDMPLAEWGVPAWSTEEVELESVSAKDVQEDDFDESKDHIEVRCKRGDVWQLGDHRLMCGDSVDLEDVKRLMGGVEADMVFTDPPYGVSYTEKNEFLNSLGEGHRLTKAIENDSKPPQEMYDFWVQAFKNIYAVTKERMAYYITAPQGGDLLLLLQAVRDSGFMLKHQLIWNKNNHVLGRCDYNYKHEPIIYGWKIGGTHSFVGGSKFKTSVWDIDKPLKNDLHPTMKPIELVAATLQDNSQEGMVVLDLFGGSGTTLIAAEETNRKAYLMEYDEHYCDVIIARWEKFTGKQATKIN